MRKWVVAAMVAAVCVAAKAQVPAKRAVDVSADSVWTGVVNTVIDLSDDAEKPKKRANAKPVNVAIESADVAVEPVDMAVEPVDTLQLAPEWESRYLPSDVFLPADDVEDLYDDEDDQDWDAVIEELHERLQEPINLNTATREELEQFPFLSDLQVQGLLSYVYLHGDMMSLNELQVVDHMDYHTRHLLMPFVYVAPSGSDTRQFPRLSSIARYGHHELITRLDLPLYTRQGYTNGKYLGSKQYHSARYAFNYGDYVRFGLTAEKDAGEPLFALHNGKGYDYYSPYLLIRSPGRLSTVALGNYRLSFGMGLTMNGELSLGKSFGMTTPAYRSTGIKKHSSTGEYNYMRGVALTVSPVRHFSVTAFYSHRNMDGVVEDGAITSILKTGLHRTQAEADKVNRFTLQAMGGHLAYDNNRVHLGATGLYYFYNLPYTPTLRTYSAYYLQGQHFYNASIDYKLLLRRWSLAGEVAVGRYGYATINRLTYHVRDAYSLMLIHRLYTKDYWALYARAFSDGSTTQNEHGLYLAAEVVPMSRWRVFGAVDLVSFPYWKYRISKPSHSLDVMSKISYDPAEHLSMYVTYRYRRRERDVTGTSGAYTSATLHHKLRYRLTADIGPLTLRATADFNHFRQQDISSYSFEGRMGWMGTLMAAYADGDFPLSGALQASYFHTDDYDSRVYASERGLLNTFYTPSYYGHGYRVSALLRYKFRTAATVIAKVGHTAYFDRDTISSGNDLIASSHKTDVQLQLRLRI